MDARRFSTEPRKTIFAAEWRPHASPRAREVNDRHHDQKPSAETVQVASRKIPERTKYFDALIGETFFFGSVSLTRTIHGARPFGAGFAVRVRSCARSGVYQKK